GTRRDLLVLETGASELGAKVLDRFLQHALGLVAQCALALVVDHRVHELLDHALQPAAEGAAAASQRSLDASWGQRTRALLAPACADEHVDHELHDRDGAIGAQYACGHHHAVLAERPGRRPSPAPAAT